jgi:hypothetical protein
MNTVHSAVYEYCQATRPLPKLSETGTWRIGARGNILFPHRDDAGALTGLEIKNRGFTGFSTGGTKSAWLSHASPTDRALVIAESAIDALSYAHLRRTRADQYRYLSTAGALNPQQHSLIDRLLAGLAQGCTVIAAVDRDPAGDAYAEQFARLASRHPHLCFRRHSPARDKDWNDVLQRTARELGRIAEGRNR